jgi:hypothetical protein
MHVSSTVNTVLFSANLLTYFSIWEHLRSLTLVGTTATVASTRGQHFRYKQDRFMSEQFRSFENKSDKLQDQNIDSVYQNKKSYESPRAYHSGTAEDSTLLRCDAVYR